MPDLVYIAEALLINEQRELVSPAREQDFILQARRRQIGRGLQVSVAIHGSNVILIRQLNKNYTIYLQKSKEFMVNIS